MDKIPPNHRLLFSPFPETKFIFHGCSETNRKGIRKSRKNAYFIGLPHERRDEICVQLDAGGETIRTEVQNA